MDYFFSLLLTEKNFVFVSGMDRELAEQTKNMSALNVSVSCYRSIFYLDDRINDIVLPLRREIANLLAHPGSILSKKEIKSLKDFGRISIRDIYFLWLEKCWHSQSLPPPCYTFSYIFRIF